MKFLHLGDLHLGKTLGDFDLIEDQRYILNQILGIAEKESIDGVLIAGDVYDKSVPREAATKLLDEFLIKLAKKRIKVFMVSGNHDSDERLNYGLHPIRYLYRLSLTEPFISRVLLTETLKLIFTCFPL